MICEVINLNIIKRVKASLFARTRSFVNNHFELFADGKKLKKLKDKYKGKRCFICGNGPSLSAQDLDILHSRGEYTFGMNRIFKIFPQTQWRPTFYICEDHIIMENIQDEVNAIDCDIKFIPTELKWYYDVNIKNAYHFNKNNKHCENQNHGFSYNAAKRLECTGTVSITCIQLAYYMGFSEVYLIGVDHNFNNMTDKDGNKVIDNSIKNYFCEDYDKDVQTKVVHDLYRTTKSYECAKKACDEVGFKVFNATRVSKLDVFPRVDLDKLLEEKYGEN